MDWNTVHRSAGDDTAVPMELVEICWRMRSLQKSTRVLECGMFRTEAPGLEVRCGYGEDDLLRSQRTAEIGSARELAEQWRQAVLAKGGFEGVA